MMHIAICDDDVTCIAYIQKMLSSVMTEPYRLIQFESGEKLDFYIDDTPKINIQLIFLDINLISQNGIELAAKLRHHVPDIKVIFISGNPHYCQDIFVVNPTCFLLKPIQKEKLISALDLARSIPSTIIGPAIAVQVNHKILKIPESDILYVESKLRKVSFVTKNETFDAYGQLGNVHKMLSTHFVRCHSSYIVNLNAIESIRNQSIHLHTGRVLSISKSHYKETKEAFVRYLGGLL